jgi:hypothetical protein
MDVYPIVLTMMKWGDRWLASGSGPPMLLHHRRCGHRLDPVVVCDRCDEELVPRGVQLKIKA